MRTSRVSSATSDLDCICKSVLFDEVHELLDGMNPGFAWIFYFVDNGSRNFMDCFDGMRPAVCGVLEPSAFCGTVYECERTGRLLRYRWSIAGW